MAGIIEAAADLDEIAEYLASCEHFDAAGPFAILTRLRQVIEEMEQAINESEEQ